MQWLQPYVCISKEEPRNVGQKENDIAVKNQSGRIETCKDVITKYLVVGWLRCSYPLINKKATHYPATPNSLIILSHFLLKSKRENKPKTRIKKTKWRYR